MAKKRNINDIGGINIYHDPKKGTIMYDWLTKKGYQLTSQDIGKYSLSVSFFPVAIILAYVCYVMIGLDLVPTVVISIAAYIIMKLAFRFTVLNKLPYIENYQRPDSGNIFVNAASKYSNARLILLLILSTALVGLSLAYLLTGEMGRVEKTGVILLTGAAIAMLLFSIITFVIKKKNENKTK